MVGRWWRVWGAVVALVGYGVVPAGAGAETTVSVQVPAVQRLEGDAVMRVFPGSTASGSAVVKSNIPWTLVAGVESGSGEVFWRTEGGTWKRAASHFPVLSGQAGVHQVPYQVRLAPGAPGPALIRLSVLPARP